MSDSRSSPIINRTDGGETLVEGEDGNKIDNQDANISHDWVNSEGVIG